MEPIVIALGCNLGPRRWMLERAVVLIERGPVRVMRRSRLYWSRPWGESRGPTYLNAAILVRTRLRPLELLHRCRGIEREMGRVRSERWAPRTIDLDLIFHGRRRLALPELTLPHPRWRERDFVVLPLLDLGALPPGTPGAGARRALRADLDRAHRCVESTLRWL